MRVRCRKGVIVARGAHRREPVSCDSCNHFLTLHREGRCIVLGCPCFPEGVLTKATGKSALTIAKRAPQTRRGREEA